jgi:hypothetical protein
MTVTDRALQAWLKTCVFWLLSLMIRFWICLMTCLTGILSIKLAGTADCRASVAEERTGRIYELISSGAELRPA